MKYFAAILIFVFALGNANAFVITCDKGLGVSDTTAPQINGEIKCSYDDGKLAAINQYKNGELTQSTRYAMNGQMASVTSYKNGMRNGAMETYLDYMDNPKRETTNYVNDNKSGWQIRYHPDGKTIFSQEYVSPENGESSVVNFNMSGKPMDITCGEKFPAEFKPYCSSPVQLYTSSNQAANVSVPKNIAYTGNVKTAYDEINYKNGQIDGERKIYDDKGNLAEIKNYVNGNIGGEQKNYFPNSNQLREVYDVDPIDGKVRRHINYWQNGKLQSSKEYQDTKTYIARRYNDQGQLTYEATMKDSDGCNSYYCQDIHIGPAKYYNDGDWFFEYYDDQNNITKTVTTDASGRELETKNYYPDGSEKN